MAWLLLRDTQPVVEFQKDAETSKESVERNQSEIFDSDMNCTIYEKSKTRGNKTRETSRGVKTQAFF